MKKAHEGATLIEVILVIVIGAVILYMSIQQYLSYRRDADTAQVIANINTLFQAMTGFYKQECYGVAPNGILTPGKLNPTNPTTPPSIYPINIVSDLTDTGYLTTNIPLNPLINPTGPGTKGYVTQFNQNTTTLDREICMTGTGATKGPYDLNCATRRNVGEIVLWTAQVAVRLNNPAQATQYLNLFAGDCLSSASGTTVTPCASSGNTGNYVVWERLPSNANTKASSGVWPTMPSVSQFKQMYTTYPILGLTNGSLISNQYYYCGN